MLRLIAFDVDTDIGFHIHLLFRQKQPIRPCGHSNINGAVTAIRMDAVAFDQMLMGSGIKAKATSL